MSYFTRRPSGSPGMDEGTSPLMYHHNSSVRNQLSNYGNSGSSVGLPQQRGPHQQYYNPRDPPNSYKQVPNEMDIDGSGDVKQEYGGDRSDIKARPWLKKKFPVFKVNKKAKQRRQNAHLRKILQPKNATMAFNELKTGIKFTYQEYENPHRNMYVVKAQIDGKTYSGQGTSKTLAKNNAAEKALRGLFLQKMSDAVIKGVSEPKTDISTIGEEDSYVGNSNVGTTAAPDDDIPWGTLASFALHKLFTEWQSETQVPILKCAATPNQSAVQAPMKLIPDNPTERHPVMLLNQLKPGLEFKELSREGVPPNVVFTLSVTVDGATYFGEAKNKKDAKKEAAKAALAGSFGIQYG